MANGKDAFEERLKRLNGGSGTPTPTQQQPMEQPTVRLNDPLPRPRSGGNGGTTAFALLAVAMLVVGGGAFATMVFAPELIFSTEVLP